MNLVGDRKLSFALVNEGITSLAKIPAAWLRNPKQLVQVRAHRQKKAHVDRNAIRRFLDSIQYPAFFLDLETVGSPIPLYDRTRPWEHVPFQFSLRIVRRKGAEPVHHVYLADGKADPRPEILKRLRTLLGDKGSIIAYNATFEKNCLEKAAEAYPSNAGWFRRNRERFLDLLQPFREFAYYSPKQGGSTSLKNVLPALTGRDPYEGLAIADGGVAGAEFCRVTFESGISDEERQRVREALEKYCGIDTAGMVEIVAALRKAASA